MTDLVHRLKETGTLYDGYPLYWEAAQYIETLEVALLACVQYHIHAAAECRSIAAVNQHNDLGIDCLGHAIDHDIAAEALGDIARVALAQGHDK